MLIFEVCTAVLIFGQCRHKISTASVSGTVVVCTMTALVIIVTGVYDDGGKGVEITSNAFSSVFGSGANIILTLAVVLFAFLHYSFVAFLARVVCHILT